MTATRLAEICAAADAARAAELAELAARVDVLDAHLRQLASLPDAERIARVIDGPPALIYATDDVQRDRERARRRSILATRHYLRRRGNVAGGSATLPE